MNDNYTEADCVQCLPVQDDQMVRVLRVIDGDSILISFIRDNVPQKLILRVYGIDSPELHSKNETERAKAIECKLVMERMIGENRFIQLKHVKLDKFGGRIVADASCGSISSIAAYMIENSCSREYFGTKKASWHFDNKEESELKPKTILRKLSDTVKRKVSKLF